MAATIKDIARITGLGYATISAHLNGVRVKPKNQEAIDSAVKELGYIRNDYARGLKLHKSMTIGVLIPEFSNLFSTTIISEMEDVLRNKGYGVIGCDCNSDPKIEKNALQFLMSKMVDGLIVMPISTDGESIQLALDQNIPTVVFDRVVDVGSVSSVTINNREVSREAVKLLIENGHKNVAIITGNDDVYTSFERKEGCIEALQSVNIYNPNYVFRGGLTVEGSYLVMKDIVSNYPEITAIFVTNYEMSVGAIIAINESGKKIYDDYSFIGFDNHELSRVFTPKLTNVSQPLRDIARVTASAILSKIEGKDVQSTELRAEIIMGDSIRNIN